MHALGEGFRETVRQRLHDDRGIVVVGALEALGNAILPMPAVTTKPPR
jgi:hypothetical protein